MDFGLGRTFKILAKKGLTTEEVFQVFRFQVFASPSVSLRLCESHFRQGLISEADSQWLPPLWERTKRPLILFVIILNVIFCSSVEINLIHIPLHFLRNILKQSPVSSVRGIRIFVWLHQKS